MKFCAANNPISGKTVVCGIIGDPIEHTISPAMHNAAFQKLNLDYVYLPFRVKTNFISQAICGITALNLRGLNVTIPHKKAVLTFLDEIDPLAEVIGAVNTIVNNDGVLKGYNTDAFGFIRSLTAENIQPEGKNIVILGSGGAARSIAFILADRNSNLTILNRHEASARELANRIMKTFRREAAVLELNDRNLKESLKEAEILVNTTSVGMTPLVEGTLVPSRLLKKSLAVVDIIYNPARTRLLNEAAQRGARVVGGLEMLVWQGAAAFELWTGREAPVEVMKKAAIEALGQQ
jgi:shikimate dehydrogenase